MSKSSLDDDAVLAGVEVDVPAKDAPPVRHTTRTLADVDPPDTTAAAPLTTDTDAQDEDSVVTPTSS
jgi:hypothetical protein